MKKTKDRYLVVEKSCSAHCCFEATVVDTKKGKGHEGTVCECFNIEDAKIIAEALNSMEKK